MAEEEFDGCECIWSPEFAMQRLLNFIRQNQEHCTDSECIDVSGRVAPQSDSLACLNDGSSNYMMLTIFTILAVIMFFIRPETILNMTGTKPARRQQRRNDGDDGNGNGQPPPPAVN